MAANGYFGFTPGGTQFGAPTAQFVPQPQYVGGQPQPFNPGGPGTYPGGIAYNYGRDSYDDKSGPSYPAAYPPAPAASQQAQAGEREGNWSGERNGGHMGRGSRGGRGRGRGRGNFGNYNQNKPPASVHYCDVCRISCAGSQTFEEHLKGAKHKKKEEATKVGPAAALPRGGSALHCELCDVACTGSDAYAAHIRGSKHQRVVKLHQKLGKPIPSHEPTIISNKDESEADKGAKRPGSDAAKPSDKVQIVEAPSGEKIAVPKLPVEQDFEPIGQDYIDEVMGPAGDKVTAYKCRLCDCQFNDLNAKEMHLKGRRHRAQYKKKVDHTIELAPKPPSAQRRDMGPVPAWAAREFGPFHGGPFGPMGPGPFGPGPGFFGGPCMPPPMFAGPPFNTINDRFILAKGSDLALSEEDRASLFNILIHVERGLRNVCDAIGVDATAHTDPNAGESPRILKGVLRVGDVADGLLMKADPRADLVLLCSVKPTLTLLKKILALLPKELDTIAGKEGLYKILEDPSGGFDIVPTDPAVVGCVSVTLTSPLMRLDAQAGETQGSDESDTKGGAGGSAASATPADPPDVLDREKCLEALAQLRHSKWFQARLAGSPPCAITIRIVRDLKKREPAWGVLSPWAIQLLVQKALISAILPIMPGDIFKRVLEIVSAGIILPDGPGLLDPCEREITDAAAGLTVQQRNDLTFSAQTLLRMFCFRKVNKILGMERLYDQPKRAAEDATAVPEKKIKVEAEAAEPVVKSETAATVVKTENVAN